LGERKKGLRGKNGVRVKKAFQPGEGRKQKNREAKSDMSVVNKFLSKTGEHVRLTIWGIVKGGTGKKGKGVTVMSWDFHVLEKNWSVARGEKKILGVPCWGGGGTKGSDDPKTAFLWCMGGGSAVVQIDRMG